MAMKIVFLVPSWKFDGELVEDLFVLYAIPNSPFSYQ
jgi:hypothetical protein